MNPALIVMAILGCADDGSQCQTVKPDAASFRTVEACNAASANVLGRLTDLSYPVIMAQCQKAPVPAVAQVEPRPRG